MGATCKRSLENHRTAEAGEVPQLRSDPTVTTGYGAEDDDYDKINSWFLRITDLISAVQK